MVRGDKTTLNFYTISSNFNEILLKLCNKIINSEENLYVNFHKSDTMKDVDKFLWVSQKNNFLPHKTYGEKIFKKDKIILFDGCYKNLKRIEVVKADISSNNRTLSDVKVYNNDNNVPETKKEIVENLAGLLNLEYGQVAGLEKSPKSALKILREAIHECLD